jgi:hypothetical protein
VVTVAVHLIVAPAASLQKMIPNEFEHQSPENTRDLSSAIKTPSPVGDYNQVFLPKTSESKILCIAWLDQ